MTSGSELGLTDTNRAALAEVRARARRELPRHVARIEKVLAAAAIDVDAELLLRAASDHGDVTLNFHPDRLLADGRPVAQALHDEGVYRSQFETSVSSGGLTAYPGGDRDHWERSLFAGAYQAPGVHAGERPRYGGLNLMNQLNGACPGFGSCHLRLRRAARERTTLTFGDSSGGPTDIGLPDAFAPVMAPLVESIQTGRGALGRSEVGLHAFADGLLRGDPARGQGVFAPAKGRPTRDYVEAQVHGFVRLEEHVAALVIDSAFADTPIGELLEATAKRYAFEARWEPGFALELSAVPREAPDAGGDEPMRWQTLCADGRAFRLAERVVDQHGTTPRLDAANIGQAAVSVVREPERWRDWGAPEEVLQHLKDLWVMLGTYG